MATVSVIIPAYNAAGTLLRAVESVLNQTFQDLDLFIVDDASTDDTAASLAYLNEPRIRLLSHAERKGPAAARNTGLAAADGDFVAFLDSDDEWLPQKLERQLHFMRSQEKTYRVCCTGFLIFTIYQPEGEERIGKTVLHYGDLLAGCRASPGSTLVAERTVFEEVGLFNESLRRLEDWEWLLRYTQCEDVGVVPEALARVHSAHSSLNYADVVEAQALMVKERMPGAEFSRSVRAQFHSALENEVAAAAYKNGCYARAVVHMARSFWYYPFRSQDTLKRIARAIWIDLLNGNGRRTFLAAITRLPKC